jgi:DNA mismatch repair protein MutS
VVAEPRHASLVEVTGKLDGIPGLHGLLQRAIISDPPVLIRDGGVIAPGYDEELDRCEPV